MVVTARLVQLQELRCESTQATDHSIVESHEDSRWCRACEANWAANSPLGPFALNTVLFTLKQNLQNVVVEIYS